MVRLGNSAAELGPKVRGFAGSLLAKARKRLMVASGGAKAAWYDGAYSGASADYLLPYSDSAYLPVWEEICSRITPGSHVLEIGCGPGQLARMLHDRGIPGSYVGFDFSPAGVALARNNLVGGEFHIADARSSDLVTDRNYDTAICTEVLEHIKEDLKVLRRVRGGAQILATVPDFDYESHVRHFASKEAVLERYGSMFESLEVSAHHHANDPGGDRGTLFLIDGIKKRA